MNKLDPLKVVLAVVYPERLTGVCVEELAKDRGLLKSATKLAYRNGLYYYFLSKLKELNINIWDDEKERWNRELERLSAFRKTLMFLNDMRNKGLDYILIKACTKIPHVPRDVDIFMHAEDREKISDVFKHNGMDISYSSEVETSFCKEGYLKLDVYSRIEYLSMNFIDEDFLCKSKMLDNIFGIKFPSLNNEANFLLLLVHSIFGHRSVTLLDFLHMKLLMHSIKDMNFCKDHAYKNGWGTMFDISLEKLDAIYKKMYKDEETIFFPYLFDQKFIVKCINSIEGLSMNKRKKVFLHLSFWLDRFAYELAKSPVYDALIDQSTGRRIFNSMAYFVRKKRGDRHGIHVKD